VAAAVELEQNNDSDGTGDTDESQLAVECQKKAKSGQIEDSDEMAVARLSALTPLELKFYLKEIRKEGK
jgi:hypothetical protein